MRNKDYREIQISSSWLVFIFLGMIIAGGVIFLLGVSVGKKQAQIINASGVPPKEETTQVEKKEPLVSQEPKDLISKELESHQKFNEEAQKQKASPKELYYIQVGAFYKKEAASSFADQFKKEGFPTLVLEPFSSDKKSVYRVRIGGFSNKEEAEQAKEKLKLLLKKKKDYFIIKG